MAGTQADHLDVKWRSRSWEYPDDGDTRVITYLRASYRRPGSRARTLGMVVCGVVAVANGLIWVPLMVVPAFAIGYAVWRQGVTHP